MPDQKTANLSGTFHSTVSEAVFNKKLNGNIGNYSGEELMTYESFPEMFKLSEKFGVRFNQVYISDSESPQAYAWPSIRITKGLINILGRKEVFATLLHELGHRRVAWRFVDYIIIPGYLLLFCYLIGKLFLDFSVEVLLLFILFRFGFGYLLCRIERIIELKVDSYVAGILKEKKNWLVSAICKAGRSISFSREKPPLSDRVVYYLLFYPFKTHPSLEQRIKNIQRPS